MQTSKIFTNDNCVGCNVCISNCPCGEANVAVEENGKNKIYVDSEKCILCGECVRKCIHDARDYVDDTERFFADLRSGQQISVIAAPAIRTNFDEYTKLLGWLRKMGASNLFDTSFGADICTWAHLRYMTREKKTGLISQPCPAIVNYIERYTAELLPKLSPVHSPAMCTAVYMKKYKKISGKYAFLSPCIAKRDEFTDSNTGGLVSYNVTYRKLLAYMQANGIDYRRCEPSHFDNERHGLGAIYPMPGGLKANVEQYADNLWIQQVEGQPHACHFLDKYTEASKGSENPFLIDILNCQHGCNSGTGALRSDDDGLAVGRAMHKAKIEAGAASKKKIPGPDFKKLDRELTLADFCRAYAAKPVSLHHISRSDVEAAFSALRKDPGHDRKIDCRSCGYPSCQKMAEAVAKGINHVENCVEYFKSVLREQKDRMEEIGRDRESQAVQLRAGVDAILEYVSRSSEKTDTTLRDVRAIDSMISQMNEISAKLGSSVTGLQQEINKYVKMTDEIVSLSAQTNLLALNASVEAARAGQHGRGFAVVAEQIKRLSDQSQQSAKGAMKNNEVVAPLLREVNEVSDIVLSEAKTVSANASNILKAITELSEIQRKIAEAAAKMSDTGGESLVISERVGHAG